VEGPVLLCGLGRVGWRVLECLRSAGVPVVAVDTTTDPADPRLGGVRLLRGDCRDAAVLQQAGVADARGVIVATSDDLLNISCALLARRLAPQARIVLRMFNQNLVTRLGKAVSNVTALSVSALSAPLLALTATTGGVLATFPVGEGRRQVAEVPSSSDGPPVAELDRAARPDLLAHVPAGQPARLLLDIDAGPTVRVQPGDRLVVVGTPADVRRMLHPEEADADVLWAGRVRRFGRMAYRTVAEMDRAVKVGTAALLVVVLTSTAIYRFGLGQSVADGLYKTISVVATGSDLGGQDYPPWGKAFVSVLRVFGTVVVAAFTAILTNYLIRARLGGALEVRRIPDGGHVVVIGLGNVGYRVVQELAALGERPVVIDRRADNPFVPSCRRKGVPVLIGDATVRETLQQARVKEARAVIAATSADLVNLEIALLVAELNEKQRVVVRVGDSVLAETARTAAGVKMAVSLPELAAPAFVAALLGDRVLGMFPVGGRMLAAVELSVDAEDATWLGRSVAALAVDYRFMPVAVVRPDGRERPFDPAHRVAAGDRLTAVVAVSDLDRVTRRPAAPADWAVEVTAYPLSARDGLALLARTVCRLGGPEAVALVGTTPFVLATGQTRGQAEELLSRLRRARVTARLVGSNQS
jgi:Trk K+ transport system NAD-binding subunit